MTNAELIKRTRETYAQVYDKELPLSDDMILDVLQGSGLVQRAERAERVATTADLLDQTISKKAKLECDPRTCLGCELCDEGLARQTELDKALAEWRGGK